MPNVQTENLPKGVVKLTITVSHDELVPALQEAAKELSEQIQIPGFRPGKADYETVKRHVGEMKIYEHALEDVVRRTFTEAVLAQNIETVGSPSISVDKLAPGNDLVYTAEITRMPAATRIADLSSIHVDAKPIQITDEDLGRVLADLSRMQTKEMRATSGSAVGQGQKVVVDMNLKKDGVAVEGGQAAGHAIYLNEEYYVPGFKEQLAGMKEGDQKTFSLPFPADHFQKHLAGAPVDFEVTIKEIYDLDRPDVDDVFAQALGQKDLSSLKELLKKNMTNEQEDEEQKRQEREMLEQIAAASTFEDIPDLLVNEEINKMIHELEHAVEQQGGRMDEYLSSIKKTLAQVKLDMTPQALMRIKVAILLRALAKQLNTVVEPKELDTELDRLAAEYENEEVKKRVYTPMYREYTETLLRNRKVIAHLRGLMVS